MFKHPLISYYILNVFAKLPIHPMRTHMSILETMCYRIIVSVFQVRLWQCAACSCCAARGTRHRCAT